MNSRKINSSRLDNEIFNLFWEMYPDKVLCDAALRNANKAFSLVSQDILYKAMSDGYEEEET